MIHSKAFARGAALALAVVSLAGGLAVAAPQTVLVARMSGANEVPPNDSKAHGSATFRVVYASDTTGTGDSLGIASIEYKVRVSNLNDVTAGHIHIGAEGVAGPVAVDLRPRTGEGRATGVIAEGVIMAADLVGPLTGMTLSDLWAQIQAGEAYVNIHTTTYPGGEIRGQIGNRGGGGPQ